ncbi:MAG: cell wall hydrolase [Clostridia bacterium]
MKNIRTKKKLFAAILWSLVTIALIGCGAATTGNLLPAYMDEEMLSDDVIELDMPASSTDIVKSKAPVTSTDIIELNVPFTPEPAINTPAPSPTPSLTPEYTVTEMDGKKGYVYSKTINLRNDPNTQSDILAEYKKNDKLKVTGESGEWYRVEIDNQTGFMLKEFVHLGSVPTPTPKPKSTSKPKSTPKPSISPTSSPSDGESDGGSGGFSADDIYLTAQLVSKESSRSDIDGYRAVANVILNRVNSKKFPNSVEGVIFQGNGSQFSPAKNESSLRAVKPTKDMLKAVEEVFGGNTILADNVMYFRAASSGESWGSVRVYYGTYGGNAFFS